MSTFCPYCGSAIQPGMTQCPNCNAILSAAPTMSTTNKYGNPAPNPGFAPPAPGFAPPGPGFSGPNRSYSTPSNGYTQQNPGFSQPNPGYSQPNPGFSQPNPGYTQPNPGYSQPNPGYSQPNPGYSPPPVYAAPNNGYRGPAVDPNRPILQLRTNRALWKYIIFGFLTFGIYELVVDCHMVRDLNTLASGHDGKRTMHPLLVILLGMVTLGIYPIVWNHRYANRISAELQRRGIPYSFSAKHFWLWNVLGSLIVVGPYIFKHKQMFATNKLCADYNVHG